MAQQTSNEQKEHEPFEEALFTHSDLEYGQCLSSCPWKPVVKHLKKEINKKNKQINEMQIQQLHNEHAKQAMVKRWNGICDQNAEWCKDYFTLENQSIDLESKINELEAKLSEKTNKCANQEEENADLQRQHDVAVLALKELVTGIFLLTRGKQNTPVNEHVKSVKELTTTVFSEFIEEYFNVDLNM